MNHRAASPKVLVAPLDWGLGHATRCIPVVRELLKQGCNVWLAGEGKQKLLLRQEFPLLPFLDLPGYRVGYASSAWGLAAKIVAQIPKLLSAINEEQIWMQKVVEEEKIDAVISDNRYGLHHSAIPSIFITHQLRIKAPVRLAEEFLQEINYGYINKFTECWVPDAEGENALAGELSHPQELPVIPLHYVGALSRFNQTSTAQNGEQLFIVLSGPEPQRTLLEEILLKDLEEYKEPVVLVRGLPGNTDELTVAENVSVYNHLPAAELEEKLRTASLVIASCGYSTVMDLAALKKRSILIPTPGQTEQEYLAPYLMKKNFAFCVEQKKFRLMQSLRLAKDFVFKPYDAQSGAALQKTVSNFVAGVKQKTQP